MLSPRRKFLSRLRRYFFSGLIVWLPIWATIVIIKFLVDILDTTLLLIPEPYRPAVPGVGVILTLVIILLTGFFAGNFIGTQLGLWWEAIVARIPLVRSIYNGLKQVIDTFFKSDKKSFHKVILIQYPCEGVWTVAFQTGESIPEIDVNFDKEPQVTAFVPTTPNITAGFLLILPKKNTIELNIPVDQALKFVVSLGVVVPAQVEEKKK
jgi:uncharacterized membrane protein